jgi:ribonucleotide monophosphatase NagD (HAD superfamily)
MADSLDRAVLLDLEGTLFAKSEALPGAAAAVATLREQALASGS